MKRALIGVLMGFLILSSVYYFAEESAINGSMVSAFSASFTPVTQMWNQTYGGTSDERVYCMNKTTDGGFIMAGYTYSFGAGGLDAWLVKTNSSGYQSWNKTYGGTGEDRAYSVVQTSDGGYAVAGYTYSWGAGLSDAWLIKTDSSGTAQWNKTYGGTQSDQAFSVIRTSDGGYALAGYTGSSGAGLSDFWLIKTDSSGTAQWNKTFGGSSNEFADCVVQTGDGGYALAGYTYSFGAGITDAWLVKTDSSGNQQWNKTYGGTDYDYARSIVQTSDGGYAIGGSLTVSGAGRDAWIVKTDSSGNAQWNKTFGGSGTEDGYSIIQASDGGYGLACSTTSFGAGSMDSWLVKTDIFGNQLWNITYGGAGDESASSIVQTSDGGYAFAGFTNSFGAGGDDFWLVKVSADAVNYSFSLNVASAHGSPNPSGNKTYLNSTQVTCYVPSPVYEGGAYYVCTGFSGTGSVPTSDDTNYTSFSITKDSNITWNWAIGRALTIISAHGSPTPDNGTSIFANGTLVTCTAPSATTEAGVTYVCTGWTGTGSVPSNGTLTAANFNITQDSTLTWNWAIQSNAASPSPLPSNAPAGTTTTPSPTITPTQNTLDVWITAIVVVAVLMVVGILLGVFMKGKKTPLAETPVL